MLFLRTLGSPALDRDGEPVPGFEAQRRGLAILAVLAADGGVHRDRLMALLWPESDAARARGSLKQALHQLRLVLGTPVVVRGPATLHLDPAAIDTDVGRFLDAIGREDWAAAVALYTGPFLDGAHLNGPAELDRWVEERRADLAGRWAGALERLAEGAESRGDPRTATDYWKRLQGHDPADSRVILRLMLALEAAGRRAAALQEAREHQRRLQEDWELAPDPHVAELAARLQAAPRSRLPFPASPWREAVVSTPTNPGTDSAGAVGTTRAAPRASRRISPAVVAIAAVLALALAAGAVRAFRPAPGQPAGDPDLVAVAPFQALDPALALWSEGLADVLIRDLDGAGPLRTVAGAVSFRDWPGDTDRAAAAALGRRTGAALVIYGSVARLDADSVALRAWVLDRSAPVAEVEVRGPEVGMGRLADSLSIRILGALGRDRPIASSRRVSLAARSLPALRAFLRGEQFYRRGSWDSAMVQYALAVEADPKFALAFKQLSMSKGFGGRLPGDQPRDEYLPRAVLLNRGLPPRDSLGLLADSLWLALAGATDPGAAVRSLHRLLDLREEAARRYPEDIGVLYLLGEARVHLPHPMGGTPGQALEPFERAIALDPGFVPAYEHAVELAFQTGHPERAREYARAAALASGHDASTWHLLALVLDSGVAAPSARRALAAAPAGSLLRVADYLGWATDSAESAVVVARELLDPRHAHATGGVLVTDPVLRPRHLAMALAFRGHLRAAAELGWRQPTDPVALRYAGLADPFVELAIFGAVPDSVAARTFGGALSPAAEWGGPVRPFAPRHLRGASWWSARGDTAALHRLAARAERAATEAGSPVAAARGRYLAGAAAGYLALARGDSLQAARRFGAIPDSLCVVVLCHYEKVTLARLLLARGEDRLAAALLDLWGPAANAGFASVDATPSAVLAALERARAAERLGDTATARRKYRFVVEAWRRADSELQPFVAEARAGLGR